MPRPAWMPWKSYTSPGPALMPKVQRRTSGIVFDIGRVAYNDKGGVVDGQINGFLAVNIDVLRDGVVDAEGIGHDKGVRLRAGEAVRPAAGVAAAVGNLAAKPRHEDHDAGHDEKGRVFLEFAHWMVI